jgi:hypothetical protein
MNAWRIYPPWTIGNELSAVNHTGYAGIISVSGGGS